MFSLGFKIAGNPICEVPELPSVAVSCISDIKVTDLHWPHKLLQNQQNDATTLIIGPALTKLFKRIYERMTLLCCF